MTDPHGRTTLFSVDGNGDLVSVTKPDSELYSFGYSSHRMTSRTTPKGDVTTYAFRGDGTVQTLSKPGGATTTMFCALDPPCGGACVSDDQGGPTLEIPGVASVGRQRFTPQIRHGRL